MRHSNFSNELFSAPLNGNVTEGAHFLPCYFHQKEACFEGLKKNMSHMRHVIVKSTCETCPEKKDSGCNHFCTLARKWYGTPPFGPLYWGICTKKNAAYASCPKYDAYASYSGSIWQEIKGASQSNGKKVTFSGKMAQNGMLKSAPRTLKTSKIAKIEL